MVLTSLRSSARPLTTSRLIFGYAVFATCTTVFLFLGAMYCLNSCQSSILKAGTSRANDRTGAQTSASSSWWDSLGLFRSSSIAGRDAKGLLDGKPAAQRLSAFLVVLVLSSANNMERRSTIRQTWLKDVRTDILHLFAIGSVSTLDDDEKRTLQSEIARFQDVLYLPEVNDTYSGLSKKILHAFTWIDSNVAFNFLLKVDDDSFARLDDIALELESLSFKDRFYWGFFDGRASVFKRGKWAEQEYVLCDNYIPYALGGGYVLSVDMIQFVATNRRMLKLYNSEDVSVGTWLAAVDVRRVHDSRFDTEYRSRGCSNAYLVMHKQSVDLMREKHWSLQERGKLCATEQRTRLSYEYNWKAPPSQCCVRNDSKIP